MATFSSLSFSGLCHSNELSTFTAELLLFSEALFSFFVIENTGLRSNISHLSFRRVNRPPASDMDARQPPQPRLYINSTCYNLGSSSDFPPPQAGKLPMGWLPRLIIGSRDMMLKLSARPTLLQSAAYKCPRSAIDISAYILYPSRSKAMAAARNSVTISCHCGAARQTLSPRDDNGLFSCVSFCHCDSCRGAAM